MKVSHYEDAFLQLYVRSWKNPEWLHKTFCETDISVKWNPFCFCSLSGLHTPSGENSWIAWTKHEMIEFAL